MRLWSKRVALAALIACSAGVAAQKRWSSHSVVILDETQAEADEEAAPAPPKPKPDPAAEARKRLEQARAAELRRIEQGRAARDLARFTSPRLTRFADDREFARYIEALQEAQRLAAAERRGVRFAQAQTQPGTATDASEPVCPPENPDCLDEADTDSIVVSGSRIAAPSNPSITNNQLAAVDEGDIVKQIGHHLLVLQDGRVFVADVRAGSGRGLALVDRVDVYRDPEADTWYDEMLVVDDRVLVTGYSYADEATELNVLRLSPEGQLASEGVFHLSSDDYYSGNNYATRIVEGRLIVYTPFRVSEMETEDGAVEWPVVRRWLPSARRDELRAKGRPRFAARDIYRPVRANEEPTVHAVSVCPLGERGASSDLSCRTTAFVGPSAAQWYVDETDAYLWTADQDYGDYEKCARGRPAVRAATPALVHRIPHKGSAPGVAAARGVPTDQFSFEVGRTNLRALVTLERPSCYPERDEPAHLSFFDLPLTRLGPVVSETPVTRYTALPGTGTRWIANRFTDRYLVYGGLSSYRGGPPIVDWSEYADDPEALRYMRQRTSTPPAYVVPIANPRAVRRLDVRQTVIRAERVGDDILLTGYRSREGLRLTYVDLSGAPRIASSVELSGRFESEGRSHAFNSLVGPGGGGLMGVPTVPTRTDAGRWWWRSRSSNLSFLRFDRRGRLSALGELRGRLKVDEDDEDGNPNYDCEVSCIDWYGNSRPIFTEGRVFALSGTELIEGRVARDGIEEVFRLDLTAAPAIHQASAR